MYINFGETVSLGQLQQSVNVGDVTVHTSIRNKAEHMEGRIVFLTVLNCGHQRLVGEEISVLDGLGDTCQLLVYNAACTHI